MTNRTAPARASRVALLLAMALVPFGALPSRGASSVEIDARALVGGWYEAGGWVAVAVTLVNDGEATDGHVTAEMRAGVVRRHVEMPAGARKVVTLYVQPEAFQRAIPLTYDEANGTARTEVEVSVMEESSVQLAIVGDGQGTLRPQLIRGPQETGPEPINLTTGDIPERPEPLDGLSALIWAGDSASLGEAQRRSLERWVAEGGQLVVLGGPDWQARTAAFTDLLPVEGLTAVDGVAQDALASWSGADQPAEATATVSTGTLRDDARALISSADGTVLASTRSVGAGRVVLIGTDLATLSHRGWEGAPRLWGRILPAGAFGEQFMGGGFPMKEEMEHSLGQALNTLPSLQVPPAELLLAVIVGYILLIGPVSYIILRRMDRRELAWITAPALIVLFTACSFGIGRSLKGSEVLINQISLIRATPAARTASVETYAGIYSPDRAAYDLSVEADALMGRLADPGRQELGGRSSGAVILEQGNPARLRGLAVGVSGFEAVRAVGVAEHEPALSVSWSSRDGRQVGTVTNTGESRISDIAYISSSAGELVGDLEPGDSVEFTVASGNVNGSASEQVYGFSGFESATDAQRRVQMRRQVIDALVGYGGFGLEGEFGMSSSRGPYLIGWIDGEGPLPVRFDGQEAERYATTVEVLAARPPLPIGEVTIQPHQMSITVVNVEGDAVSEGPGMMVLGDGSVTYGIALPLEASGLVPTDVEIVVGPDPGIVMNEPGDFGGFWPQGYTVEVRDPQTGDWTLLGTLDDRSRFTVDPAGAVDPTGRIEVRVSGQMDPNFGEASVFVGARVKGVIGE